MVFTAKKTYYNLETTLSLPGVSLFYCIISGIGLIVMYLILPETEDRSLEDIELHFSDNSKNLTDRKIAELSNNKENEVRNISKGHEEMKEIPTGIDNKAFVTDNSKV